MQVCYIIGGILFVISMVLSLFLTVGSLFKNIGVSYFNVIGSLLFLLFPVFCLWLEWLIYDPSSTTWVVMLFPLLLNLYFIFVLYIALIGSMIIGRKHIYRLGHGFLLHKYTFDKVKRCSGSYSTDTLVIKGCRTKSTIFNVTVTFSDGSKGDFATSSKESRKAQYFLDTLNVYRKNRSAARLTQNREI